MTSPAVVDPRTRLRTLIAAVDHELATGAPPPALTAAFAALVDALALGPGAIHARVPPLPGVVPLDRAAVRILLAPAAHPRRRGGLVIGPRPADGRDARAGTIALRADEVAAMIADLRSAAAAPRCLIVDSDPVRRRRMLAVLERRGYRTTVAWTPLDAIAYLEHGDGRTVFAVIADDALDGHALRAYLAEHHPEVHVVVVADRVRAGTIVEAALDRCAGALHAPSPAVSRRRGTRFTRDRLGPSPWGQDLGS